MRPAVLTRSTDHWRALRPRRTPEIAVRSGLGRARGALVGAAKAANGALDAGDVITSLNGEPVQDFRALARLTGGMRPGTAVEVSVLRRGEAKTVALRLGKFLTNRSRQPIPSAGPPRDEEASIAMPAFVDEKARLRCRQRFSGAMGILQSATGRRGGPS